MGESGSVLTFTWMAACGVLFLLGWLLAGFLMTVLFVGVAGYLGYVATRYFVLQNQRQILEEKYRKDIDALAARASLEGYRLASHIRGRYQNVYDVW